MNKNNPLQAITIVGGGTAGWICASALAKALPREQYSIKLIESDQIGTVGVGEATIPPIRDFHRMLGISEQEFVRETQATFKLGIKFDGWYKAGESYFHPFGDLGRRLDAVPFHQYWLHAKQLADCGQLDEYSLCSVAAMQNKFAPASSDPNSILSALGYAYHFDASLYAKFLRAYAEKSGVERIEGKVTDVCLNKDSGFIDTLQLESGRVISGDLFIDCSGFSALLIGKALKVEYEDWSHWLPADSAWAVQTEKDGPAIPPYTLSTAHSAGWQWRIPLQHRIGNGFVYSSQFSTHDNAQSELLSNLVAAPIMEPKPLRFTTGKRKHAWFKNCVAIGLSSGFLEPLESTSIHLVQTAITRLLQLLPGKEFSAANIAEYNQANDREVEFVRDFIILHYHANQRDGDLWAYCRNMSIPESLAHKIELFRNRGRVPETHYDLFKTASWVSVMRGQGIEPQYYDPMASTKPNDQLLKIMNNLRHAFASAVSAMPEHSHFINENCAAAAPASSNLFKPSLVGNS